MLPTFNIVKDEKDLVSGKIFPRKVLNYMPFGFGQLNPTMSPVMLPKPINTATDLTISPSSMSPFTLGTPTLSPMLSTKVKYAPSLYQGSPLLSTGLSNYSATSPFGSVEYSRTPLIPSYQASPCGQPCSNGESFVLGRPIIKLGNMISQNIPGLVEIMVGNNRYSINVPPRYIRNIADEIAKYRAEAHAAGPLAQFRLIANDVDWHVPIKSNDAFNIINSFNRQYPGLNYKMGNNNIVFNDLYNGLRNAFGYSYTSL